MRKRWLTTFSLVALSGCSSYWFHSAPSTATALPAGVQLIEQHTKQGDKVAIPYSKYQLDNGLTVILSPDHSDPLVHVDVTYHVGSARESVGKSGFAHFFEHMMFQGSKHVGDQQHFKIITEAGGTLNGTTNRDRTNYFETVPSNQLEKMLWLESDRMGFLLDAVSQRKFEIQRDTVKNERAQNFDNRPYGLINERIDEALYPEGHPYSWQTIGYVKDLDRVDVNDLKAFFLRWYGPNNAVLTIGGDIDPQQTLAWVNKYFGSIPKGPTVTNAPKQPVRLAEDRYLTLQDRVRQPMVVLAWPTSYRGDKQEASLNALTKILGDGPNSYLYQHLVKTEKAVDAGAYHNCSELACTLYIYAMGTSGKNGDLKPIYQQLMQTLAQFEQQPVEPSRLDEITGMSEAGAVFALQSVSGKVSQLASNEVFFGQPDRIETQLDDIRAVTPQSVKQAYDSFMKDKHKVILSVVPRRHTELAVRAQSYTVPPRQLPEYKSIDDNQLNYRQVKDNFDRSVMPQVASGVSAELPPLYKDRFSNGIEILGTVSRETPTVELQLQLPAGNRFVPAGKEGLAELTADLVQEQTTQHTQEVLQERLEKLGSTVSFNASTYTTNVTVSSLEKNISQTLAIMKEMLLTPAFDEKDFQRLKHQMLEGIVYQHQRPSWLASQATRQVLFGDSLYARSVGGTKQSINSLTLADVKAFYQQHYTPVDSKVIVVGSLDQTQMKQQLSFLGQWQGRTVSTATRDVVKPLQGRHIYLVDTPDSPQSVVRMVRQGIPFDATGELFLSQLANFNLAGNFNSRLNQNLREDKGYTYGASGYFASNKDVGAVIFSAQVRANTTVASILEMQKELAQFSLHGITDDELSFMRLAVGQKEALKYETPVQKAQLLSNIVTYDLDDNYLQQRNKIVATVDKSTLNGLAAKWFNPNDYQIIVVGDAKVLRPQLEKLDLPIQDLEIGQ